MTDCPFSKDGLVTDSVAYDAFRAVRDLNEYVDEHKCHIPPFAPEREGYAVLLYTSNSGEAPRNLYWKTYLCGPTAFLEVQGSNDPWSDGTTAGKMRQGHVDSLLAEMEADATVRRAYIRKVVSEDGLFSGSYVAKLANELEWVDRRILSARYCYASVFRKQSP